MEDVIAVAVELDTGEIRYFITWGRILDRVDPGPVEDLVLAEASRVSLGGEAISARVCFTLQEAALSPAAPYFYECLLTFQTELAKRTGDYWTWRAAKAEAMAAGRGISYCGQPPDNVA